MASYGSDLELLAKTINGEAGGEPYQGQLAVGTVIINRLNHPAFPKTIRSVIYQRGQFSCTSRGNFRVTKRSLQVAKEVLKGKKNLPKHVVYFNTAKVNPRNGKYYTTIGNHKFYSINKNRGNK